MAAAAATATSSKAGPSADSYIGSLISLTSKSEIRYEGVLYNINTEESSIGLRNVRSFGTEGRKKDGPQVLPSDKIYEYILFRGSDIKDLQVKSSPPVQTTSPIHNDPAIIQSHYSRPAAPASVPTSLPSVGSGTIGDLSSHAAQMGAPRSAFQSGLPLYQPGGSLGSWGSSPPAANGSALAVPMYWPGFYAPSGGMPHLQQPPLLRPPGLPIPHSMQQPLQYPSINPMLQSGSQNLPGANAPLQSGSLNFPGPNALSQSASAGLAGINASSGLSNLSVTSSSLPSAPSILPGISALLPSGSTNVSGSNILLPSGALNLPECLPPLLPPVSGSITSAAVPSSTQAAGLALDAPLIPLPNKPSGSSLPSTTLNDTSPFVSSLSSSLESAVIPASSKPKSTSGTESAHQYMSQPISSATGSSGSNLPETSMPSLLTPGQLLQSGSSTFSLTPSLQTGHKDAEVKSAQSEPQKQAPIETTDALLPLPKPSEHKNGAPVHIHHSNRGCGRGRGNTFSRTVMKFTEDFDFTSMNEKFKKHEVWGHLGKTRGHLGDKEGTVDENHDDDDDDIVEEEDEEYSKLEIKPVYVKDDFFDSLSSNAHDSGARNGRTKFSEQRKIDTETFGNFSRRQSGRGGARGFRGGGRTRGSFYGRGYGYAGRGRGHAF